MNPETLRYHLAFPLTLRPQRNKLSLADWRSPPLAPDFDAGAIPLTNEGHLRPTSASGRRSGGGDMDTATSYLAPKYDWREEEEEED